MYGILFATLLEDLEDQRRYSVIFSDFIDTDWINQRYKETATDAELVRDYIAGMTDRYFAKRFEEIVIPRRVEGKFF
jgi:dGTPase